MHTFQMYVVCKFARLLMYYMIYVYESVSSNMMCIQMYIVVNLLDYLCTILHIK